MNRNLFLALAPWAILLALVCFGLADPCCQECKICQQCQANAKALTFPPRDGWHLVLPVEAIDGDTITFFWVVKDTGRLHGINAPELKDEGGPEAKAYLQKLLPKKPTPAKVHGKEKYGRTLLELFDAADPKSLSEKMIRAGHAKPYDGRGPRP